MPNEQNTNAINTSLSFEDASQLLQSAMIMSKADLGVATVQVLKIKDKIMTLITTTNGNTALVHA